MHLAEILVELGRYEEAKAAPPANELQDTVYDAAAQIRTRLANDKLASAVDLREHR